MSTDTRTLLDRFVTCSPATPLIDRSVRELFVHTMPSDLDDRGTDEILGMDGSSASPSDSRAMVRLDHAYRRAAALGVRSASQLARERSISPRRRARAAVSAVLRVEPTTGEALHWVASDGIDKVPLHAAAVSTATHSGESRPGAPATDGRAGASSLKLSPHDRAALMRLYHSTGRPADLVAMPRR